MEETMGYCLKTKEIAYSFHPDLNMLITNNIAYNNNGRVKDYEIKFFIFHCSV